MRHWGMATAQADDGTTIGYEVHTAESATADGTVVLVHGITESSATWDPVIERLVTSHDVVTVDLRGHGRSGRADRYDLDAMAGDIATVIDALDGDAPDGATPHRDAPHLVGHSLGGAVVSVVGATVPVASVVNVDQSLQLDEFKGQLVAFEPQLRDPDSFPLVIDGLFAMMAGEQIDDDEMARVNALRTADQDVVFAVWELLLTAPADEIAATVDAALGGYRDRSVAYLTVFGIDPGDSYGDWIAARIGGAVTEVWPEHGHYPHLVDPDRFVARLHSFWS